MLILAVIVLAILGTDSVFVPVKNNDVAVERKDLNSIQYDADLYPQTQARTTIVEGQHKFDISCVKQHMYVFGNNLHFRYISSRIKAGTVGESCQNSLKTDHIKYINIFALNKVFIDDDIEKKFDIITVIAPKWEILGERTIDLSGGNGKSTNPSPLHVKDGKPGNPGESGKNFFGIGEVFSGGKNLNIYSKGGDGSAGEDGKKGENGRDGSSAKTPPKGYTCEWHVCDYLHKKINNFKCETIECIDTSTIMSIFSCTYQMYGEPGKSGRDGGKGGNGGVGGRPGDIVLFELNGPSRITQSQKPGSSGSGGKGGVGGLGGKKGNGIKVGCGNRFEDWNFYNYIPSDERAASGKRGDDGKRVQAPNQANHITDLFKAQMINRYKTFLRANLNDPLRNNFLVNFLTRLENNPDVKSVYDILGFINELKSLEGQFYNLYKYVNFLPFYNSLLHRLSEYAKRVSNKDDKKVLAYLYTATLGRAHNLEDDLESNLISDITAYLEIVKDDINKLNEWETIKVKENITNEYKKQYKAEIRKKINDSNALISDAIIPEIQKIEAEIHNQIENLTSEVIQLQNQSITNTTLLLERKRQLQNELLLQGIFGSLKILGTVVGFMGPVGAVAGSVIDIGSGLAETLILDLPNASDSAPKNLKEFSNDISKLKEQIDEFGKQKATELENKLEIVSEEVDEHPVLKEMSKDITAIKDKLNRTDQDKITIKEVQSLEIQLNATLQNQKDDIEGKEDANDPKYKNAIKVIEYLQKFVKVGGVMADTYVKIKKRQGKVSEIEKLIQDNEAKFDKLKEYEDEIYNTMVPMIENMENDLHDIINQINNKSKVVIDVTRWKVKSTLKDMMLRLKKVTEGFKVQDSLVRCIDKLQDGMDALMNVQDHIQDYQRDQTLANFIAGVSSISVTSFDVSYNQKLNMDVRDALRDLEITIRASIVMQRHRIAIDAFKQFVFPFADRYFRDLLLPSHIEWHNKSNTILDEVILTAKSDIDHLKLKLNYYNASINNVDQCTGTAEFRSDGTDFFVWENKNHSDVISRLLSGEEVIVNADIMHAMKSRFLDSFDAIKFKSIEFRFEAKDRETQSQLNNILEEFKVTCTHFGNSYYRYQNKNYLISTSHLKISYSFKKVDGERKLKNDAYTKMMNGHYSLSPYATWKIKLDRMYIYRNISFKDLQNYKYKVDLMLAGKGHYVDKSDTDCFDPEVNNYYKPINEHDAGDLITKSNVVDFVPLLLYNNHARGTARGRYETNPETVPVSQERRNN